MRYLDHAASTTLRPSARAAADEVHDLGPGNPTGVHGQARALRARLEAAREDLAGIVGVAPNRVVFTSGGTESDNTAVFAGAEKGIVLASAVEHPAVLEPVARSGGAVVPVDGDGVVDLEALSDLLRRHSGGVGAVSVMAANNETGVCQPLAAIGAIVAELAPEAVFHTDAVQAFTKTDLDVAGSHLGMVSLTAHKIGGPVGIGALVLGADVEFQPLIRGGGQERGMRAGTPDAAGAAAFAAAAVDGTDDDWDRARSLRDRLEGTLLAHVDGLEVHGAGAPRLPTHCHVGVPGMASDLAVILADRAGLAISSGSSCASGAQKGSTVMAAMGVSEDVGALRLSLGWDSTDEDVDEAIQIVLEIVTQLRRGSSGTVVAGTGDPAS